MRERTGITATGSRTTSAPTKLHARLDAPAGAQACANRRVLPGTGSRTTSAPTKPHARLDAPVGAQACANKPPQKRGQPVKAAPSRFSG